MKLLLDENLSSRLVPVLQEAFPETLHVEGLGLRGQPDATIWAHARQGSFLLVSKDDDFRQLALLRGAPPKVVVLAIGNAGNTAILRLLLEGRPRIEAFARDAQESVLVLRPPAV